MKLNLKTKGDDTINLNLPIWVIPNNFLTKNLSRKNFFRILNPEEHNHKLDLGKNTGNIYKTLTEPKSYNKSILYNIFNNKYFNQMAESSVFKNDIKRKIYYDQNRYINSFKNLAESKRSFFNGNSENIRSHYSEYNKFTTFYNDASYVYRNLMPMNNLFNSTKTDYISKYGWDKKSLYSYHSSFPMNRKSSHIKNNEKTILGQKHYLQSCFSKRLFDFLDYDNLNSDKKESLSFKNMLLEKALPSEKAKSFPVNVAVNMGGISQSISSKNDADYFIDKLASELTEAFTSSAQGVYQ